MTDTHQPLLDQLQDPEANQRRKAAIQLGKLGDPLAVTEPVDVFCNDEDLNVQEDAT